MTLANELACMAKHASLYGPEKKEMLKRLLIPEAMRGNYIFVVTFYEVFKALGIPTSENPHFLIAYLRSDAIGLLVDIIDEETIRLSWKEKV